ncbi:hypothetical protein AGR7A_Lc10114 [Agrobacterium deltaense NCPPB 1641]|uniref:Uncharacterized protein n=1 Tax=Agrobacterium deltaense NCPPB 1641 TaxID=1183425 RepID=A0A1S7TS39_9HYPH|nr:hypothetical protein AGR7A_Lc10114 [Agrobacterium deltaense NCPPB 1641]
MRRVSRPYSQYLSLQLKAPPGDRHVSV